MSKLRYFPVLGLAVCSLLRAAPSDSSGRGLTDSGSPPSRIVNFSILTSIGSPGDTFTMGFVVGGDVASGNLPLLVRAAGPALSRFSVDGALPDPRLELFTGATKVGENDNWGGAAAIVSVTAERGAFPFATSGSLDAAMLGRLPAGGSSVRVSASDRGTGRVLAEIYDATPAREFTGTTPRLINVSVLKEIGSQGLAAGFVIAGSGARTVLIRAIGPTLSAAPFGVGNAESNPRLVLVGAGETILGENDDWGAAAVLSEAFAATGAFDLAANSRDAALVVTLVPGDYSVLVAGAGAGLVLVEIYEVPKPLAVPPDAADFTIAVLPDTQYYTKPTTTRNGTLAMFTAQTDWIQSHRDLAAIAYVAHLGDMVDDGDVGGTPPAETQWANAAVAMRRLESPVRIPFGVAVGNHEQEPNGNVNGTTAGFNQYFGVSRFLGRPYYGGHYGSNNNSHYDLFSAGGRDYIAVFVEYDATNLRPEVTAWANDLIRTHRDRRAILVTHYLAAGGGNYGAFGAQGARLYNATKGNDNLFLALGGHVGGLHNFRRDPVGAYGRERMISLVADYQFEPLGGAGYMRLYRFAPLHGYMTCRTYSPYLGQYRTDSGHDFTQSLDPRGPAEEGAVALSNHTLAVAAVLSRANGAATPDHSTVAVSFQSAPRTNRWSPWIPLTGQGGFRHVHAVTWPDDRLAVFASGHASDGWICQQTAAGPNGSWTAWQQIPDTPRQPDGSKALSYIQGVRLSDNRLAAIGWTDGGAVFHARQGVVNGPFGGWTSLGGSGFRQGDVVRLADDRLVVFAVGHETAVEAITQQSADGGWGGWVTLPAGGSVYTHVSAVPRADQSIAVFATRGTSSAQAVRTSVLAAGAAGWSTFANVGSGGNGFARVHAVVRPDGRIGLFGSAEHGVANFCVQASPGGSFGTWRALGPADRFEIGSVKGVVLGDNTMAAVSHGAATVEYYTFQSAADGEWSTAAGLPVAWMR